MPVRVCPSCPSRPFCPLPSYLSDRSDKSYTSYRSDWSDCAIQTTNISPCFSLECSYNTFIAFLLRFHVGIAPRGCPLVGWCSFAAHAVTVRNVRLVRTVRFFFHMSNSEISNRFTFNLKSAIGNPKSPCAHISTPCRSLCMTAAVRVAAVIPPAESSDSEVRQGIRRKSAA
jgi:hypothetical protein